MKPVLRDARTRVPMWLKDAVPETVKSRLQQALDGAPAREAPEPPEGDGPPEQGEPSEQGEP